MEFHGYVAVLVQDRRHPRTLSYFEVRACVFEWVGLMRELIFAVGPNAIGRLSVRF